MALKNIFIQVNIVSHDKYYIYLEISKIIIIMILCIEKIVIHWLFSISLDFLKPLACSVVFCQSNFTSFAKQENRENLILRNSRKFSKTRKHFRKFCVSRKILKRVSSKTLVLPRQDGNSETGMLEELLVAPNLTIAKASTAQKIARKQNSKFF